jgi:hypothetical protein
MICAVFASVSLGQAVYGSIFGTVTDPSGAAVPNATVTITNIGTNVSVTTKTNERIGQLQSNTPDSRNLSNKSRIERFQSHDH